MKARSATLIAVAVVAVVVAFSSAVPALRGLFGGNDVPLYEVKREDFVRKIYADGNLKSVEATLLGPPPAVRRGLKIAWLYPDGTPVREGEVVIRFDPTDMEKELRDGRHERATTEAKITQTSVREEGNSRNLERDSEMADLELGYASEFQAKDTKIYSRVKIIESEIDQTLATQRKDHADQSRGVAGELAQTELDLLTIERSKADLKIEQAETGLRKLEVEAPHDGIFVLKEIWGRKPEVGQMVWGGFPVAEIPKMESMEAKVFVLEADAGGLEQGLDATVTLDAHPGVEFEAKVGKVDKLAQRRNSETPVQYFAVVLDLARTDPETMKPGQRVQAVVYLNALEDVVTVPRQAVFEVEGESVVYRKDGKEFEPAEIKLGPAALGRVVVEEGLEAGDLVALRDPTRRQDDAGSEENGAESSPVGSTAGGAP